MKRITYQKLIKRHAEGILSHLGYDHHGPWKVFRMNGMPCHNRRVCYFNDDFLVKINTKISMSYALAMPITQDPRINGDWELFILKKSISHLLKVHNWYSILEGFLVRKIGVDLNLSPEENIILADMGEL